MKHQWKMILCLMMALLMLSSCTQAPKQQGQFAEATQFLGPTDLPTDPPTNPPVDLPNTNIGDDGTGTSTGGGDNIFNMNPYDLTGDDQTGLDAINEEDYIDTGLNNQDGGLSAYVDDSQTYHPYAGSTPIPLIPVDAPTPTPRPSLSFIYGSYAAAIGVSFEAPVGWIVDESVSDVIILSEPIEQIKEGQQCIIRISTMPVDNTYSEDDLKTEVLTRLDDIGSSGFDEWKPSYTSTRYMMGTKGVYANYTGSLLDGTEVGGRIHYVSSESALYGVEIVFPRGYKDDYLNIFTKIRESLTAI
ncbi:MAG: hypothetical protein GX096_06245 [Clostridiales bacterium]|nr:hypothetical protein [Clostridiales bacterium]